MTRLLITKHKYLLIYNKSNCVTYNVTSYFMTEVLFIKEVAKCVLSFKRVSTQFLPNPVHQSWYTQETVSVGGVTYGVIEIKQLQN